MCLIGGRRTTVPYDLDDEAPWPSVIDHFADSSEGTSQDIDTNIGGGDVVDGLLS